MKKFISVCLIILLATYAFASCADRIPPATNTSEVTGTPEVPATPQVPPTPQASETPALTPAENFIAATTDEELNEIIDRAIGLVGSNQASPPVEGFSSVDELSTINLLRFFTRVTTYDERQQWYNKEDSSYHVPVKDITAVLDQYLDGYIFNLDSIISDGSFYYETEDSMIFPYNGIGWYYGCKIENVEPISEDTVRIDIAFCDWSCLTEPFFKTRLTLKVVDDGYRYISFVETEPEAAPTPGQYATAQDAYLADISSVLDILDELEEKFTGDIWSDYYENSFCGALEDLDGDEQPELIMAYYAENKRGSGGAYYYKIYTYKAGNSVLLDGGTLFVDAGAPRGGLSIVNYDGEQYLCIWNTNSNPGDGDLIQYLSGELLALNEELTLKHTFDFTFHSLRGEILPNDDMLFIEETVISLEDFLQFKNSYDNPVKELCTVGKGLTNYRLRQLYEDLKNR